MTQQTNGHANPFPTKAPEPRERPAPVRVLVVELRDGNVVDTTEPSVDDVIGWLKERCLDYGAASELLEKLREGSSAGLGQPGNPARDPRLTYIETNPATSFSVGGIEAAASVDVSGPPVGTQELKLAATPLLESCGLCGGDGHTSSDHFAQPAKTDLTHDDVREHVRQVMREEREGATGKLISERADEILLTAGDIPRDGPHGGAIIARARIDALTRALDERLGRG